MKKLTLFLIPIAILLACEPILPGPGGGGGITNPDNKTKGALIKTINIHRSNGTTQNTYFISYNADSVVTKISDWNVQYPSNNKIKVGSSPYIFSTLQKNGFRINYHIATRHDSWTGSYDDTLHFRYSNNNIQSLWRSSVSVSYLQADNFIYDGNNLISFGEVPRIYEFTYEPEIQDLSIINTSFFNNIALYRGGLGTTYMTDPATLYLPIVSLSGKQTLNLIASSKNTFASERLEKYTYEKDTEGRIIRMNVLDGNNGDALKAYYMFEY